MRLLELLSVPAPSTQKLFLSEALGRILAHDVVAQEDDPKVPTAAMDGYAIVSEDQEWGEIEISGVNPAGSDEVLEVRSGCCIKTFTGAKMPQGADTLIPIEHVEVIEGKIRIHKPVPKGFSVRPVGESYVRGEVLIAAGERIGFAQIGVLAALGYVMVQVQRKVRIAVLSTGSEIVDVGVALRHDAQIRSTNHITIEAIARSAGAEVIQMGVVGDRFDEIMEVLQEAMTQADIVVSTGGVSVGDYDFVKEIVPKLGAEVIFQGVRIKPGQHLMLAQKGERFILALPGFAYSSSVTFILYGLGLMRRFEGREAHPALIEATLRCDFKKRGGKSDFTACNLSFEEGRYWVDFEGKKSGSSAILTNLLGQSALMLSGEEDTHLAAGTSVHVLKWDHF
ncbi:MAG: molybdopterin molybdotransferase MoeA [Campylobacterales bacterium]|nr:molybdopterin molybdotransferase MoeA [Campylobacterales bacterium]